MSGLSIRRNDAMASVVQSLIVSSREMGRSMEKLSSGFRVNAAMDGAGDLLQSEKLRAQMAGLEKAIQEATASRDVLALAEGGLGQIQNLLRDMRDCALHSLNSGVTSREETAADQARIDAGMQAVERILASANLAGRKLLDNLNVGVIHHYDGLDGEEGEAANQPARDGEAGGGDAAPDAPPEGARLSAVRSGGDFRPGLGEYGRKLLDLGRNLCGLASDVIGAVTAEGDGKAERIYHLSDIQSWGAANLMGDPALAVKIIDRSGGDIAARRAQLGGMRRYALEAEENVLRQQLSGLAQAEAGCRDADYAGEMTNFTRNLTLQRTGARLLSAAMDNSLAVLDLLA